jgi:hypothetical protein
MGAIALGLFIGLMIILFFWFVFPSQQKKVVPQMTEQSVAKVQNQCPFSKQLVSASNEAIQVKIKNEEVKKENNTEVWSISVLNKNREEILAKFKELDLTLGEEFSLSFSKDHHHFYLITGPQDKIDSLRSLDGVLTVEKDTALCA